MIDLDFPIIIAHCNEGCEYGVALRHFLNLIDESVSAFASQIWTHGPLRKKVPGFVEGPRTASPCPLGQNTWMLCHILDLFNC